MDSSQLLGITTFTYMFSTVLYIAILVFNTPKLGGVATIFTALAWFVQTAGLVLRWIESYQLGIGHAPLTNMYESVVFFAWTIILLYLLIEWKFKTKIIGAFAVPFAFLAMAYASFSTDLSKAINPLVPALQSNWLIAHVVTCFVGYAAFAVAAALGIMYLLKSKALETDATSTTLSSRFPSPAVLDDIIHKTMVFGFIWLTGGIITGAIWANSAWGTYWSWDPKRDVVADHLVLLRNYSPRPLYPGVVRNQRLLFWRYLVLSPSSSPITESIFFFPVCTATAQANHFPYHIVPLIAVFSWS